MSAAAAQTIQAQRRQNYRIKADWWVRIHVPWEVSTQLVDVSLGGARLKGELPCTPGVSFSFAMEVPEVGDVPFTAEVVWVDRGESGVRFTGVNSMRSQMLREVLLKEERRLLREKARATVPDIWTVYDDEAPDEEAQTPSGPGPAQMRAEGLEPPRAKPTGT